MTRFKIGDFVISKNGGYLMTIVDKSVLADWFCVYFDGTLQERHFLEKYLDRWIKVPTEIETIHPGDFVCFEDRDSIPMYVATIGDEGAHCRIGTDPDVYADFPLSALRLAQAGPLHSHLYWDVEKEKAELIEVLQYYYNNASAINPYMKHRAEFLLGI